jgi:PKD repeat protein
LSSIDCTRVNCTTATLGEAVTRGAVGTGVTLLDIQAALSGIRLGDLAGSFDGFGAAELQTALAQITTTLGDLASLDDLALGDLAALQRLLDSVTLGSLEAGLAGLTFDDLVGAIIDPFTGRPAPGLEDALRNAVSQWSPTPGTPGTLFDLGTLGDVTLGDLLSEGYALSLDEIAPILGFITVDSFNRAFDTTLVIPPNLQLGDVDPRLLGALTLADIARLAGDLELGELLLELDAGGLLEGVTLGDLLLALLDPASLAYGGVELTDVDVTALPSDTVGSTTFAADFTLTASSARTIELQIQTPRNASYVAGSGQVLGDGSTLGIEPSRFGDLLIWSFVAQPGVPYTISFDVLPTLTLGSTSLSGVARVVGTDISLPATASVTVVEGTEQNDFTSLLDRTVAVEDFIYLTYIADADDIDVFEIVVEENDELIVQLSSLDADLDLVLWGRRSEVGTNGALSRTSDEAPLFAITDPDSATSDAEPLSDFPRLDLVDSSLGVVAVSNEDGTKTESITTGRLAAGSYYVQVYGANGATNIQPAALQLKILEADTRPECVAIDLPVFDGIDAIAPVEELADPDIDTLLLINERRLEQLHGEAGRSEVRAAADRLVAAAAADPSLGISPVVVPVDAYPLVQAAYDVWDSAGGSCDPDAANAVVAAINEDIIDPVRDQLTHVVILGPDELIPMARLADETRIANEYDFRHEFDGDLRGSTPNGRNAFTSSFWESSILSDEPYGDAAARSLGDRFLYVTDIALGRVVETPGEIADALDTYLEFDGTLDINTATVLGYDFLADGSDVIAATLAADLGVDSVDRELARGPDPTTPDPDPTKPNLGWTAARATEKLRAAATNTLVSLNAHFDHYRALPAIGDKVVNFDDNLIAERVRIDLAAEPAVDLAQSLVFSMGCHSGLSVSDITIGRTNVDWAQTFGQLGSLYVGNTGFGYGDTVTVAYTEQLMALFAEQLTTPFDTGDGSTTVGQALAWAKNDYIAGLQSFSVYDEKAVQESTFYGLPFYRVGLPTDELPAAPTNAAAPDATGTPAVSVSADATNDEQVTDSGVYFSNTGPDGEELVIVSPGRPIQPKTIVDVSADPASLATVARGAIVLGMESTYRDIPNPVIASPIFDEAASQPEPELTSGVFPTRPLDITTSTGPSGVRQQLVLATGQYRADDGVQRLDDDVDLVVYYASGANDDFTPPTIGAVESAFAGDVLTVSLTAGEGAEVDRVYVLVAESPGLDTPVVEWRGVDLARVAGNRWTGSLALTPGTENVEFIVQAKDTVGNVGYATNKARNFGQPNAPTVPLPQPPASQLQVVAPATEESGWYDGPVTLTIENAATPATVLVNNVALPGTFEAGDTFEIAASGVQTWQVVTESGRTASGTVRIDADGAPQVVLGVPLATQSGTPPTYASGTRSVDVICRDTSPVSCLLDIDGVPVANGAPLPTQPGTYLLSYTATDAVGNVASGSAPFKIGLVAAPIIQSVDAPLVDQLITTPITVGATFSDASAPEDSYTATIDWDDGTVDVVAEDQPTPTGSGSFSGVHTYAEPGSYDVVLTVTDSGGLSDEEFVTVVVTAPAGAPIITGLTAPTTPQLLTAGVTIGATFSDASAPFDTFTAIVDWGDGTTSPATVTAPTSAGGSGSVVANKVYAETGVYPVTVTITDAAGGSDFELYEFVVVYDPTTNGRVTGSGTYWSGPEASAGTSRWGAPAFFGYDARYKKNATLPTGETQLRLLGQFLFKSTKYDYLIVNDAVAIAEGVGTAGGKQYRFRVQGVDNGWLDFFQITIWNPTTGAVLYDNGVLYDKGDLVLLGGITVKGG